MFNRAPKKTVFTLNINGYAKEITDLTYPLIHHYADKIGAEFKVIETRRWPDAPVTYEKFQIYYLAQEMGNDWNIYIDSDTIVHPNLPDVTTMLSKDTVLHHGSDFAPVRWRYDRYFYRDGRHIGSCNWFAVASDWCIDLWHPLDDLTYDEAIANISPIVLETKNGTFAEHLIDDYTCSRNIARFGLKFTTLIDLFQKEMKGQPGYLWHIYNVPFEEKLAKIKKAIEDIGVTTS